jgi:ASTRA-associated protein 1
MSNSPAVPVFILRGHTAPVHSLLFFASNSYLASGDSEGWIVIWSLASKRPIAVWKAHAAGISGIQVWGQDKLITHGRDHKLRVWKLNLDESSSLSRTLPTEGANEDQSQPWLLHSMDMSALNFCSFAISADNNPFSSEEGVLIASPNGLDNGGVDIFRLPRESRISQIHSDKNVNTGMVMSIAFQTNQNQTSTWLVCGYEDGQVGVHLHEGALGTQEAAWKRLRLIKLHSQPVLSLSIAPSQEFIITSSADATIAKLSFSPTSTAFLDNKPKTTETKHAGQQGLTIRSDSRIFATAGWDSRVRVYSAKTLKELAVLKWHKEGCYSTAFADVSPTKDTSVTDSVDQNKAVVTSALDTIKQQRATKAQHTHWLAAGGKDGKISLWDIY